MASEHINNEVPIYSKSPRLPPSVTSDKVDDKMFFRFAYSPILEDIFSIKFFSSQMTLAGVVKTSQDTQGSK